MNILFFTNDTASNKWRADGIARHINETGEHSMFVTPWSTWNGNTLGADLVILEMLTSPSIVIQCHNLGAKVIYEADDAHLDTYGQERKNLQHIGPGWRQQAIDTVRKVDAVTVTNQELADNYARFTDKPVFVLPNYMDFDWYGEEDLKVNRTTNEIRIGWFGSKGHLEDLRMVVPALKEVLGKYPNVKFVYCGFGGMSSNKVSTEVGWGEDVFRELPRNQREFVLPVSDPAYWPMKHRTLDLDIGIAPLINDYFNRCKTPIKWMEFATLDTPVVASDVIYPSIIEDGKTGLIAKNNEEWVKHLSSLIEGAQLRKTIAAAAKKDVLTNYNIDDHWEKWLDVYQTVVGGEQNG